jgi:hypothetical protein
LKISDGALVLLSLSYAFSPFNLVVNPSWLGFINPQASLPVIVAAWFEPNSRKSLGLIAGATLFALFGGHPHPFIYMSGFLGLLALAAAWHQRSWRPILLLIGGVALGLLVAAPILAPAVTGFSSSGRSEGVSLAGATLSRVPFAHLLASIFLGPAATAFIPAMHVHSADPTYAVAIAFSLANLPVAWLIIRKRSWSRFELGLVCAMACSALLIARPNWLQEVMSHLPLVRSLRWPFREIADLLFFVHFLALLNLGSLGNRKTLSPLIIGVALFAIIFLGAPPTFNPMQIDRSLILSGRTAAYWDQMRKRLGDHPRIIVAAHPQLTYGPQMALAPFSLMGAYNYGAMFGFINVSGYSPTQAGSIGQTIHPFHLGGIYWYPLAEALWRNSPGTTLIEYLRNRPSVLRVRHDSDTFYVIYDELTHEISQTSDPEVLKKLPPPEPSRDPRQFGVR